jgi:ribosomal protein S18 acetylase RimI-like enzyme
VVQLAPVPGDLAPSTESVRACLGQLRSLGFDRVVTGALAAGDRLPFVAAGFTVVEELHLLVHSLDELPPVPPTPELRRARRDEGAALAAVDAAAFTDPFWHLDEEGLAQAQAATPSSRLRVAVVEDRAVGFAVTGRSGRQGFVQRVAVHPDAQGRHVGTALVADALSWLRRRGAAQAAINTQLENERALQLYLHAGFRLQRERLAVLGAELHP